MNNRYRIGVIGLGVIGAPIANILYTHNSDDFYLALNTKRRERFQRMDSRINNEHFRPQIITTREDADGPLDLLIIAIKNHDIERSIDDIRSVISPETVILPLQNGIHSYEYLKETLKDNIVIRGYVQGPNTIKHGDSFRYTNTGEMHIGAINEAIEEAAREAFNHLDAAGINVFWEDDINHMVWKKWMLNVAGNSVTALTLANYSSFRHNDELVDTCVKIMQEFISVAAAEGIHLDENDIEDVIRYYTSYKGGKRTSMLDDVENFRKTENEFLAGTIVKIAARHNIPIPRIELLNSLINIREKKYLDD